MAEKTVLEIQNLPESSTWPEIRSLFSEFGNIVKLYIDPTGSFGRVIFDNIESAANAQRELDGKPPLYISVSIQATKGFKARPQSPDNCSNNSFDRNSLTSPVAKMSNRNSYRNNYAEVQATLSHQYVDVFGRLVTTLESDDGEVYVSLDELKKSGFELFLSGNLPKRGQYIEEKLLNQFEMYMKIKARKFLSRTNQFNCSEDKVDEIIDGEKKQFFDGRPKRVCEENNLGSITVTTPVTAAANHSARARTTPNQNRNWPNTNDDQRRRSRSSNRGDFDQQRNSYSYTNKEDRNANSKPMRRPYTNNYNTDSNTNNSTDRRSGPRQDSSNFNTPNNNWDSNPARPSRRPGPRRDSTNFNDSNSANPSTRRPESRNSSDMNEPRANPSARRPESRNSSDLNEPRPLTRVSLPLNTSQKVTVVHIENELCAWVQLSSNVNIVEEILLQTMEESATAKSIKPILNSICAAMFCNIWFRAVVISTYPIKVQYIDYGNENTEVLTEVRDLSNKLAAIPGQAVRICFEFGSHIKLEPHSEFCIYAVMQEDDGTYIVNTAKSETPQSTLKQNFPPKPPSTAPAKPEAPQSTLKQNFPPKPCTAPAKPEIKSSIKPSTSTSESSRSQRKNVTDDVCDNGLFECIEVINDTTFVGFAMPATYNEEISTLETITAECKADPSFKPGLGDLVAVPREGEYVRGTVINNLNGRYTCALVDYGVVVSVEEVRPLPEKFKGIPEFSCLCIAEPDIVKQISAAPENSIMLKIESPAVLKLTLDDKEFVIKSSCWNPFATSPLAIQKPVEEKQTVFKNCLTSKQLKVKDIVIIAAEQDGSLLVRTRECNSLLKEINQQLTSHKGEPFKKKPEVGQLAVCSYSGDNTLYRVIITSITGTTATVEYIDYGNSDTVVLRELKTISEKLATTDKTLIKISLKGFVKTKFGQEAIALLATCSEKKEKFVVEAASGENVYELVATDKTNLSEKLLAADKPPSAAATNVEVSNETPPAPVQKKLPYITLDDLPPAKLAVGSNTVMCLFASGMHEGNLTVCSASPEVSELLSDLTIKINEHVEKDNEPHIPEIFEVCLAQFEGEWYRATCIERGTNKYGLYYIDYGNTNDVTAEEIRKMPPELSNVECIAVFCVLDGVLKEGKENVEDRLLERMKSDIIETEMYNIEVLEANKTYCRITIPSLHEGWKEAGLL